MAHINAHTFNTIEEAQQAINLINEGEGIPAFENSVTQTYCSYQEQDGYIFINADDVTESYLGASVSIELIEEL